MCTQHVLLLPVCLIYDPVFAVISRIVAFSVKQKYTQLHKYRQHAHAKHVPWLQTKDLQQIHEFVTEHVPHAILVAAAGHHSQTLFWYLQSLLGSILKDSAKVLTGRSERGTIDIKFAEQTVAQLWENSTAAREELTDQPPLVRRAVAVGRAAIHGQLPVLCSLAGKGRKEKALSKIHLCVGCLQRCVPLLLGSPV